MKAANKDKRRHHYLPVISMKGFCAPSERRFAYRKDAPEPPLFVTPTNVAFENRYYSQPLAGGGRDEHSFEDFFADVETHWPAVMAAVRSRALTPETSRWLFAFAAMMRARVPAAREFNAELQALKLRLEVKGLPQPAPCPRTSSGTNMSWTPSRWG